MFCTTIQSATASKYVEIGLRQGSLGNWLLICGESASSMDSGVGFSLERENLGVDL
jgi:hypothetical protein